MSKCPHLHRRRNTLYFRLSVPVRFQSILRVRELTQTLRTQNYKEVVPAAYKLAGEAKALFLYLDIAMTEKDHYDDINNDLLKEVVDELEREERKTIASLSIAARKIIEEKEINAQAARRREIQRELEAKADAFDKLQSLTVKPHAHQQKKAKSNAPMLSDVFDKYVENYKGNGSKCGADNKKKVEGFGNLFKSYVGEIRIDELTQKTVNDFFRLLVEYPGGRGGRTDEFKKMSFMERIEFAKNNGIERISPANYESGYKSPANLFFEHLRANYEDCAPVLLTNHIDYKNYGGRRAFGEEKQRALKNVEVGSLVNNEVMLIYAADVKQVHKYWLPIIGLFTGARVNEICQLNPQHDIVEDAKTGVWYFNLTEETPGGDGVDKSHKNESSKRKVPIHSNLIELGFIDYCERVKKLKHDRIFNSWKPKQGKASYRAEEFFRDYLNDIGLKDNKTAGKKVLGMHCLRSTFTSHYVRERMKEGLTKGRAMSEIKAIIIIGHSEGVADENGNDLSQTGGYVDDEIIKEFLENMTELKTIVERLNYPGVNFPKPK